MSAAELPDFLRYTVFFLLVLAGLLTAIEQRTRWARRRRPVRYVQIERRRRCYTLSMKLKIARRDHWKCHYCRRRVHLRSHHRWRKRCGTCMEADHYVSFLNGGPTTMANGVTACHDCNRDKGAMNGDDYKNRRRHLIGASW